MFFESHHRIMKLLESLVAQYPTATLCIGRELTKLHEEVLMGTPEEVRDELTEKPVRQKGEFVVIFSNAKE